jgi:hypothetical protein
MDFSSDTTRAVEVTTRYATSVQTLSEAWAFVMERIDSVGPNPSIQIVPLWGFSEEDENADEDDYTLERWFSVVVSGAENEADRAARADTQAGTDERPLP